MVKNFQNVEEIITDESFQAWYFRQNSTQVEAWEKWMEANPGQLELVNQATEWMKELKVNESSISANQAVEAYEKLNKRLDGEGGTKVRFMTRRKWWLSAAAAVLLIASGAIFLKTSTWRGFFPYKEDAKQKTLYRSYKRTGCNSNRYPV
jgi:transmembrane sensor